MWISVMLFRIDDKPGSEPGEERDYPERDVCQFFMSYKQIPGGYIKI
jgi:hypothetical protein